MVAASYAPIMKVAVGFIAALIVWIAQRIGLDLGSQEVNQAASAVVGFIVAYLVPLYKNEVKQVAEVKPVPEPNRPV